MLTDAEKVDVRRFMGYSVHGAAPSGNLGFLYYQSAGLLEYRLANLSADEETALRRHLGQLLALEQAIPDAGGALDTQSAGEWTRNPAEVVERSRLFQTWCRRLCSFLGIPPGPGLSGGGSVGLIV